MAETILTGTSLRPGTPHRLGHDFFGEEVTNTGSLMEMINPLATTASSHSRGRHVLGGVGTADLVVRPAVGRLAFEGLALYPNPRPVLGDEQRPLNGNPGGAYLSSFPRCPGAAARSAASISRRLRPTHLGLRLGNRSGSTDYGRARCRHGDMGPIVPS